MKMKLVDYNRMEEAISKVISDPKHATRHQYNTAGYSDEQWRWDMLHISEFDICPMYSYLHDDHIDTALRKITDRYITIE